MITKFADYKPVFDVDINKMITNILNTSEAEKIMLNYIQEDQLQNGIDARGKRIETIASQEQGSQYPYSRYTVKLRGEQGLQVNNVDLKDTGAFYDSMGVKVNEKQIEFLADFNKGANDIRDNFTPDYDFVNLTNENLEGLVWYFLFDILSIDLKKQMKIE